MPYQGNQPAEAYSSVTKDSFSGDGSTTAFTLSVPSTTNNLRVVVENVVQDPTVAYSVSGTTLTFTSAPPTGTNNIYAVNLGPAVQTVVPPDGVTVTDLNAYADGAAAFTANRATSDGTIVDLQKDGSTVGSIGTSNGDLTIGTTDVAVRFSDSSNEIYPINITTRAAVDGATTLGNPSARFKNLYLSGGVYLGGTGSANYLDDYEEGTWTIDAAGDATGVIGGNQEATYTKIGNQVTVHGVFQVSTNFSNFYIGGLPFLPYNPVNVVSTVHGAGVMMYGAAFAFLRFTHNSDQVRFYTSAGSGVYPSTSNDPFRFVATYLTNS